MLRDVQPGVALTPSWDFARQAGGAYGFSRVNVTSYDCLSAAWK
jgi:hypothetical protein